MGIKARRYLKKTMKKFEAKNSFIWLANENCQPMYMILWYNGIKMVRVSENDDTVKVEFYVTRRQANKIRKDMNDFNIKYKAVAWAC